MKFWNAEKSLTLSRILTVAVLVTAIGLLFGIPAVTEWYDTFSGQEPIFRILTPVLYLSDILGIAAVWELLTMLRNIAAKKVFVEENARCLRIISWCCFAVSVIWCVLTFWRLLAFFVAFMSAFLGLVLRVVKNLLVMAIALREENDFTI